MAQYPVINDNEVDLIRKIVENTATLATLEAGDVARIVAGTNITVTPASGTGVVTISASGGVTGGGSSGQVAFWNGASSLAGDGDMTFVTDTLTVTKIVGVTSITNSSLTATRVVFSGAAGIQVDDADFTFVTDTLTVTKIAATLFTGTPTLSTTTTIQFGVTANATIGVAADLTSSNLNIIAPQGTGTITLATANNATSLTVSGGATPTVTVAGTGVVKFGGTANATIGVLANATSSYLKITAPQGTGGIQFLTGNAVESALWLSSGHYFKLHVDPYADLLPTATLGEANVRWFKIFVGQSGIKMGDGTNGPSITASGTSPSELLVFSSAIVTSTDTISGPGAVSVTKATTKVTTTGVANALTLANGVDGQIKRIIHDVDGGSFVLTPATSTGWTTFTSTLVGESISLQYVTTRGWIVIGSYLGVIAP